MYIFIIIHKNCIGFDFLTQMYSRLSTLNQTEMMNFFKTLTTIPFGKATLNSFLVLFFIAFSFTISAQALLDPDIAAFRAGNCPEDAYEFTETTSNINGVVTEVSLWSRVQNFSVTEDSLIKDKPVIIQN